MNYIIIYYKRSKYLGFLKRYILETDRIIELNKVINDKDVVEYYFYDLKKHVRSRGDVDGN